MLAVHINKFKHTLKSSNNPRAQRLFKLLKQLRACDLPTPKWWNRFLYLFSTSISSAVQTIVRVLIHTPAFKGRLSSHGKNLYLYGGLPFVSGPVDVSLGNNCRISGQTTFSGRVESRCTKLTIGNNVDIGWQSTIAVGSQVVIGDNVRIAGRAFLFGYSGHSLDPKLRAEGAGDLDCDIGEIVLEQDVWLGTNVTVCPGVTIGQGTIVGAGSVVTKSLPPQVVAAGNPAKIIRQF